LEPASPVARPPGALESGSRSGHFFVLGFVRWTFNRLYHERYGRLLVVLFLIALAVTAGATVYVFFYTVGTSTVQTPDVQLVAGPDIGSSCTAYPCASGAVSATHDLLTVTISFFPTAAAASPYPASYYSNFAQIKNTAATNTHSIKSIQVINVGGTTSDLGSITVYYCTAQTEFSASGTLSGCVGSFAITSATGGSVSGTFPQSIAAGANQYIELAAYAASGSTSATSVTFQIAVQWA